MTLVGLVLAAVGTGILLSLLYRPSPRSMADARENAAIRRYKARRRSIEGRGGVGKNPPLSDEAKAAMRRFLDEQK